MQTLRTIPGLESVVAASLGRLNEIVQQQRFQKDARLVTPTSHPYLHTLYAALCTRLDVQEPWPNLYLGALSGVNAAAMGSNTPFLLLSSDALRLMTTDALQVILAHELGHILSGHVRLKTLALTLGAGGGLLLGGPVSFAFSGALGLAMLEWDRCSELSADRCSALALGDAAPVIRTLQRFSDPPPLAPWTRLPKGWQAPVQTAANAAREALARHPPPSTRVTELRAWADSPAFATLLRGDYPRREAPR